MARALLSSALGALLIVGAPGPGSASVPPPPPPRPFDDPALAERFDAWQQAFQRGVDAAAFALAQARQAVRAGEGRAEVTAKESNAVRAFAAARRRSSERLYGLAQLHAEARPSASAGDLQRLQDTLNWHREFFHNTEQNTLEILERLTR